MKQLTPKQNRQLWYAIAVVWLILAAKILPVLLVPGPTHP